jgi:hypothetical protein
MTKKLSTLAVASLAAALLAIPASADAARYNVRVGIGDQQPTMFGSKNFKALQIKRVRYFIPWNVMDDPPRRLAAEAYVNNARAHGASVLLHISSHDLGIKRAKLPSTASYRSKVGRLVRHFRTLGVREYGTWNEANHKSQPTWRSPKRAAQYYKILRRECRGCTIVALDVLDQSGVERYMRRFYRALGKSRRYAKIVGIHNYSDVNRRRTRGTRSIMRTAKRHNRRSTFWLTETGGIVKFGRSFPYSPKRAAKRLGYLFNVTKRYRRQIKRVYVYGWTGASRRVRFDAGITTPGGKPRPAYKVLRKNLKRFKR